MLCLMLSSRRIVLVFVLANKSVCPHKKNMSTFASQEGRQDSSLRTIIWRRIYVQKEIVGKQRNKNQTSAFLCFIYYSVRLRDTLPKRLEEPYNEHLMFIVWLTTNFCYSIIGMIKQFLAPRSLIPLALYN